MILSQFRERQFTALLEDATDCRLTMSWEHLNGLLTLAKIGNAKFGDAGFAETIRLNRMIGI